MRAQQVIQTTPRLSIHDGFAFVVAELHDGCILVTGDSHLRALAVKHQIEVHGVLWIIDEISRHNIEHTGVLLTALRAFEKDPSVRLPRRELLATIRRYEGLS